MIESLLFWFFALLAVGGALGVVIHPNPVKSALLLVLTFFSLAGLYVLLMAHFIAVVHVAVYAGAIMVLFLFVIMLLNVQSETMLEGIWGYVKFFAFAMALVLFAEIGYFGFKGFQRTYVQETDVGTVERVGKALFSEYVFPFEIASILLLVAMMGAIFLSKRHLGAAGRDIKLSKTPEKPPAEKILQEE